jgi:hypothetical protein
MPRDVRAIDLTAGIRLDFDDAIYVDPSPEHAARLAAEKARERRIPILELRPGMEMWDEGDDDDGLYACWQRIAYVAMFDHAGETWLVPFFGDEPGARQWPGEVLPSDATVTVRT